MKDVLEYIDKTTPDMVARLQTLIRQPSVSAKNEGITKCAKLVRDELKKSGIHTEILRLGSAAPLVYAEIKSKKNPHKTLLFYNHYDVQPVEPVDLWDDAPFSGKIKGNKVFGRGSSDDKGELIARIKAVEAFLKTSGDVPCNVKFVIEGEEETGSEHMEEYLKKFKKKFACDGVIWEFGYVDSKDRPVVSLGMKGLLYAELSLQESKRDVHSSLAVLIKNPAWRLIDAVQTLRDPDGRILIKGWYDEVRPLTESDRRILAREPFDGASLKKEFGVSEFVKRRSGLAAKEALAAEPTCNIAGLSSGYSGPGAKTVLPANAMVKLDFRLVPDMDPKKQETRLKRHLKICGFSDITVKVYHGEAAARTDPYDPMVADVVDAAQRSHGKKPVLNISNAGTGPMSPFVQVLGAPCVAVGSTHVFARIHSPNEFARIDLLRKAAKCMCFVLEKFGSQ